MGQSRVRRENERLQAKYKLAPHPQTSGYVSRGVFSPALMERHWVLILAIARVFDKALGRQGLTDSVLAWYRLYDDHAKSLPTEIAAGKVHLKLACAPGCSHCCITEVTVLPPEVITITDYIKANFSDREKLELSERMNEHQEERQLEQRRPLCPLNVKGHCTIYPVRPFTCRTFHSFDLSACYKKFVVDGDPPGSPLPPMQGERFDALALFWNSAVTTFRSLGVTEMNDYELVSALQIALNDPSVGDRLLSGEEPFHRARRTS